MRTRERTTPADFSTGDADGGEDVTKGDCAGIAGRRHWRERQGSRHGLRASELLTTLFKLEVATPSVETDGSREITCETSLPSLGNYRTIEAPLAILQQASAHGIGDPQQRILLPASAVAISRTHLAATCSRALLASQDIVLNCGSLVGRGRLPRRFGKLLARFTSPIFPELASSVIQHRAAFLAKNICEVVAAQAVAELAALAQKANCHVVVLCNPQAARIAQPEVVAGKQVARVARLLEHRHRPPKVRRAAKPSNRVP